MTQLTNTSEQMILSVSQKTLQEMTNQTFDRNYGRRQEMARLWRLLARFKIPKDIFIYSRNEVEYWRHTKNHIIAHALHEGKLLYERA